MNLPISQGLFVLTTPFAHPLHTLCAGSNFLDSDYVGFVLDCNPSVGLRVPSQRVNWFGRDSKSQTKSTPATLTLSPPSFSSPPLVLPRSPLSSWRFASYLELNVKSSRVTCYPCSRYILLPRDSSVLIDLLPALSLLPFPSPFPFFSLCQSPAVPGLIVNLLLE